MWWKGSSTFQGNKQTIGNIPISNKVIAKFLFDSTVQSIYY